MIGTQPTHRNIEKQEKRNNNHPMNFVVNYFLFLVKMNIAMLYQELNNIPKAIECLHKSLKCNEIIYGCQSLHTSGCFRALAIAYSKIENFKEALNYEKQNYNILKELFGEGDIRTVESNIYLKQFTANAVKKARIEKVKGESFCHCFFDIIFNC
jgi:tetratricopeptide (TPR) repeat protein